MQMTGTEKQLTFATKIVEAVQSTDIDKLGRDQKKLLTAYREAFAAAEQIKGGDKDAAQTRYSKLDDETAGMFVSILEKLSPKRDIAALVGHDVDAGRLIDTAKGFFYGTLSKHV